VYSEFAGCASSFKGAMVVNPYDPDRVADTIHTALTMPLMTKKIRHHQVMRGSSLRQFFKTVFVHIQRMFFSAHTRTVFFSCRTCIPVQAIAMKTDASVNVLSVLHVMRYALTYLSEVRCSDEHSCILCIVCLLHHTHSCHGT
jgi:Glycosyltransferase family 20